MSVMEKINFNMELLDRFIANPTKQNMYAYQARFMCPMENGCYSCKECMFRGGYGCHAALAHESMAVAVLDAIEIRGKLTCLKNMIVSG